MKNQLLFYVFLIILSCSKNNSEIEIQENNESAKNVEQYYLFINSSDGGTIKI